MNYGSNQPKDPESCKASELHHQKIILPEKNEGFTQPPRREAHVHVVNNLVYQFVEFKDGATNDFQGVNDYTKSSGAQETKEESKDKFYCMYHVTKVCCYSKNILQEKINNRIPKVPQREVSSAHR